MFSAFHTARAAYVKDVVLPHILKFFQSPHLFVKRDEYAYLLLLNGTKQY